MADLLHLAGPRCFSTSAACSSPSETSRIAAFRFRPHPALEPVQSLMMLATALGRLRRRSSPAAACLRTATARTCSSPAIAVGGDPPNGGAAGARRIFARCGVIAGDQRLDDLEQQAAMMPAMAPY